MLRACLVSLLTLTVALGCRKNVEDQTEENISSSGAPAASTSSDWAVANDIAVRIDRVRVQKPVVEEREDLTSSVWKERELEESELVIWVSVENRTKARKLDYRGWDWIGRKADPIATDEHGNRYAVRTHEKITRRPKGYAKRGAVNPGDAAISDVLFFERPVSAATKLLVTLPPLAEWQSEPYQFEIPTSAWTGTGKAVPIPAKKSEAESKREEKFAGLNEWSQVGAVRVRFTKASLGKVTLLTSFDQSAYQSKDDELMLSLEVENRSTTNKVTYSRWSASRSTSSSTILDEHGNKYVTRDHELIKGAPSYGVEEIRPGGVVVDVLCVEPPVDAAKELTLTLHTFPFDTKERYRFKIPASAWKK